MSTHNIGFHEEMEKIIYQIRPLSVLLANCLFSEQQILIKV